MMERGDLEGFFTAPQSSRTDTRGYRMRGHRRVYADSVAKVLAARTGGEAKSDAQNS